MGKGRILEINKYSSSVPFVKQGVKKSEQYKYENHLPGGNGTYVTGGMYLGTHLDVKISIYDDDNHVYTFDVYEQVKEATGKKSISPQLMEKLKSHLHEKVDIEIDKSGNYLFDVTQIL